MKVKTVQIPEALLLELCKYHLCDGLQTPERSAAIQSALREKMQSMEARDLYSIMRDPSKSLQEREEARQAYLDARGIPPSYRW